MKKVIIFDFDGVLADSFETFYPLIKDCMSHIGLSLSPDQYRNFFIGNVHKKVAEFIDNKEKHLAFLKFRKENYDKYYFDKNKPVKLFPKAKEFIKKIKGRYILTIASSGKKENIEALLNDGKIKEAFRLILADSSTSKQGMIQEIISKLNIKPEKTIMISDTVGDISVAKEARLKTIAVTWGFHSPKLLKTAKPDYIVKNFKELEQTLLTKG